MAEVKQESGHLMDRVHKTGQEVALTTYNKHTLGRVLRRPRPDFIAGEISRSVIDAVVPLMVADWQERTEVKAEAPSREHQVQVDEAYARGLHHAWHIVETLEGRPGKKQIAELLRAELRKAEGAPEE